MEVWAYMPQSAVTESLEWLTDVQRCRSSEQRRSLRTNPRQELSCKYFMTESQFGQAKLAAMALGSSSFFVPVWPMFYEPGALAQGATVVPKNIADSQNMLPVDSSIMVWESASKWERHTVAINSTNPAYPYLTLGEAIGQSFSNPVVVPLRVGEFAQEFEATRTSFKQVETSARFRIVAGDDYRGDYISSVGVGLYREEVYDGRQVVTDRSLVASGVREQFERRYEEVDSSIGLAYRFPTYTRPGQASQIAWSARDRASLRSLLYWLHSRKGQWKSFWVPSWNGDITVTHEISASDTSVEISDIGFRTSASFPLDIMILTKDGTRIYKRVTGASAGDPGKELLGLSAQVGTHIYTFDIDYVCLLTLSRFSSDRIEISHGPGGSASVSVPTIEVPR